MITATKLTLAVLFVITLGILPFIKDEVLLYALLALNLAALFNYNAAVDFINNPKDANISALLCAFAFILLLVIPMKL